MNWKTVKTPRTSTPCTAQREFAFTNHQIGNTMNTAHNIILSADHADRPDVLRAKISTLTRIHKSYEAELQEVVDDSDRLLLEMLRREARRLLNQLLSELDEVTR